MSISYIRSFCWCTAWYDPIQYPTPIHDYTTHTYHIHGAPLCSFCQCTVRYDPFPIHRYTTHMFILSMYRQVWPNPIPNSNTWVHHPYDYFVNLPSDMTQSNIQLQYISIPPIWSCWRCTARYDPIQSPIPIHGYTTPYDHFVNVPSGMTQSNPQLQYMSTPPLWSIIQCTVRYDLIQSPIPIHG